MPYTPSHAASHMPTLARVGGRQTDRGGERGKREKWEKKGKKGKEGKEGKRERKKEVGPEYNHASVGYRTIEPCH